MASPLLVEVADATDSDTQWDAPLQMRAERSLTKRQLIGGAVGTILLAGVATLAAMSQKSAPAQSMQRGLDFISKGMQDGVYDIDRDTGCSDWPQQMIGTLFTATSELDCLNTCLMKANAKYANYQEDEQPGCEPSSFDGAHKGGCYCFKDCTKVTNKCWDLVTVGTPTIVTKVTTPVPKGAKSVEVASQEGIAIGDKITFTGGGNSETKTVVGFGTILLDSPLEHAYPAGATITTTSASTATPAPTKATPAPSAATPAPSAATPAPSAATPAPTAAGEETPAPTKAGEETPAPTKAGEETPTPTPATPATPAPTAATPATPAPTAATPAPTAATPATPAPTAADRRLID